MRIARLVSVLFLLRIVTASDWKPIDPAELTQKNPKVEPDADSEAIFWDVRVLDEMIGGHVHSVRSHYIRIKVFNVRGRNRWSTIIIPTPLGTHISEIAARTIHPDGSVIDLTEEAIHQQNLEKTGTKEVKAVSWAMPGVEAGSVIEYRWREARKNTYHYDRLEFQRDIPIQTVRYWIKPYSAPNFRYKMYIEGFQCPHTWDKQLDGFHLATMSNVPAFRAEPRMPPGDQIRAWSLIYYRALDGPSGERFWTEYGKSIYNRYKGRIRVSREVQAKAAEITAGMTTEESKLNALSVFCRSQIRNVQSDSVSAEEREEADKNKNPADTLSHGMGTGDDIQFLFAALAAAVGFDARIAKLSNRIHPAFNPAFMDPYFLGGTAVAVNVGSTWRFYEPSATFVPHDMIPEQHEAVQALISDPKEPILVTTPASRPDQTVARKSGFFRLAEDGTLEGNIELQFTGHVGADRKQSLLHQSGAQREESLKSEIKQIAPSAEVSEIQIENALDPEKPLVYYCHVRVPAYAQRTGKRLFFAPEFFRQTETPAFPEKERRYPVYFPYAFTDEDHVTIEIPSGFEFEAPKVPPALPIGDAGQYEVKAEIQDHKRLVYTRRLSIVHPSGVFIPVSNYPLLKTIFDQIRYSDQLNLALKQAPTAGGN